MKPVIRWTLWQRRWSTLWWSVGVFGLIFINMIFYPTFKNQADDLEKSFENLPDAAVQLFGGSTDFFSPVGFLNSQVFFLMLPLILGILAISLGSNLLAREEQDSTIEALLARPVSRTKFLAGKATAGVLILTVVTTVGLVTALVTAVSVELDVPLAQIFLATLACLALTLSFGAVAFLFTAIGKTRGLSLGVASALALGGYLVSSLAGTVAWLTLPSKFFPFHYYESEVILRGIFNSGNILFPLALFVVCAVLSWLSFRRRDI